MRRYMQYTYVEKIEDDQSKNKPFEFLQHASIIHPDVEVC